ncbi:MAG: transcriptional regulator [Stygiobacter sp. RIFOXYC12_FULL_38_8]|nr:MAG: transcriptional regulator [Stygiobacter sp. GWC2_38_9]OGU82588.1 MAG: transcriptional regulator [Stygiobacter sp. RIFOXYA12_FULL_38_9]OGV07561.1 MAG: transcriptional regulator [Stygiobacter sp. RIFOXYB2_FULL_37_11]OGV12305.1 MAG: transcriptional regulator [Stygiobacter sp. RIFOXYA2_FULL_38_8]OGV13951.1 MAG: transcriptional regulator [Stygiobacter sp. RIFOXYC2_FULL_38_25]OGV25404.1 MAG: transcriptional regulator [Stygiobacter sp. RIFOXYC12_FULL_38_8]OGV80296.1 MAG: transcriptional regu
MSRKKVLDMIENGEGLNVEYKQRFSTHEKIAKEIIAFANTRGGFLFIGIDDSKKIYGIASEKGDNDLIREVAEKYCEPKVEITLECMNIEKKDVLVVEIPESLNKPHRIQDYKTSLDLNTAAVYVRVNDKSVLASKEMIKILQTQTRGKTLEHYEVGTSEKVAFSYLDKNEKITVKELGKLANISDRRASRTLIKLVRANILLIHTKDNGESYFTYAG